MLDKVVFQLVWDSPAWQTNNRSPVRLTRDSVPLIGKLKTSLACRRRGSFLDLAFGTPPQLEPCRQRTGVAQ